MKRIDVVKQGDEWVGKGKAGVVARAPRKEDAVRRTAAAAKADPQAVTVKIHKENGRPSEE
jgi:hypothetical protein